MKKASNWASMRQGAARASATFIIAPDAATATRYAVRGRVLRRA